MQAFRLMLMLLGLSVVTALAGETAYTSKAGRQSANGNEFAQLPASERNKSEYLDPTTAFLQGYRAYERRDLAGTNSQMRLAARVPDLADYALFYLASAERDNGDSRAAADDFRRLTIFYPQSVWSDVAGLEYARLELK